MTMHRTTNRKTCDPSETRAAFSSGLDWSAIVATAPVDVADLARDIDDLDAFALDARLRAVLARNAPHPLAHGSPTPTLRRAPPP
jgi:hypothetical protein